MYVRGIHLSERKKKQQQKNVDYHLNKRPHGNKAKNKKKNLLTKDYSISSTCHGTSRLKQVTIRRNRFQALDNAVKGRGPLSDLVQRSEQLLRETSGVDQ